MGYALAADVIVAIHTAYVSFVVLGQLLILVGLIRKWSWVRNLWFRLVHLLTISVVVVESVLDIPCPLTVWEHRLRKLAGQPVSEATFIGRCLHNLIFYEAEPWAFTVVYVCFALLVVGTLVLAPPRWPWRRATAAA